MLAEPRITSVVVTYNRLPLLQRLCARLREIALQDPRLHTVIVVDNASTDGTSDFLRERMADDAPGLPEFVVVTSPTNRGGAGGFHDGLAAALDTTCDLVWLMDDDGLPDLDCLDTLLRHRADFDFYGPVVVDEADPEKLVFPIRLPGRTHVVHHMAAVRRAAAAGVINGVVIPFNGVLVTRDLAQRIGNVREEFFIWGDDHEYRLRAEQAGARIGTVVAARVLHPSVGELGTPMMWARTTYNHSPSDLKHYCMARNNLINLRTYRGPVQALAFVVKTVWFYTVTRPSWARLKLSAQAMRDGLRGDFSGHRRFL